MEQLVEHEGGVRVAIILNERLKLIDVIPIHEELLKLGNEYLVMLFV